MASVDTFILLGWSTGKDLRRLSAALAFDRLKRYVIAAGIQLERINEAVAATGPASLRRLSSGGSFVVYQQQFFIDAHFFFICCSAVSSMLDVIRSSVPAAKTVYRRHRSALERFVSGRDYLEHIDERLPGGGRRDRHADAGDLGNFHGGRFTFGGEEWDLAEGLDLLRTIAQQLNQELRPELIEEIVVLEMSRRAAKRRRRVDG